MSDLKSQNPSSKEMQQLLDEWNATDTAYPRVATLAERFEAQVAATPDAVAVVFGKDTLTYAELNARADFLAQQSSPWGVPYEVVRVFCPTGTYYTNSLILNDKVLVPLFGNAQDSIALQTYQDAMPGYEVLGFTGSWVSTDALHCRTHGVADLGLLYVYSIPLRNTDNDEDP